MYNASPKFDELWPFMFAIYVILWEEIHTQDILAGGMATFTVNIPINAHMFINLDIYFNVNQVSTCWVRENLLIQHI